VVFCGGFFFGPAAFFGSSAFSWAAAGSADIPAPQAFREMFFIIGIFQTSYHSLYTFFSPFIA
jgi:hypothetical protein